MPKGKTIEDYRDCFYEVKWDGIRCIAVCDGTKLRLYTKDGNEITSRFPELQDLKRVLGRRRVVFDGELIYLGQDGRPDFKLVMSRLTSNRLIFKPSPSVRYCLFDILYLNQHWLTELPLTRRRSILESLKLNGANWSTVPTADDLLALIEFVNQHDLEGIIAKRKISIYTPGKRRSDWVKLVNRNYSKRHTRLPKRPGASF